jgi:Cu+-exporting ATPase
MRLADLAVIAGSAGFLLTFYWWFFWSRRDAAVKATGQDIQELEIEVKGGYTPDHVVVERGKPVRLKFRREEGGACTDRVLIPGLRVNQALPAYQTTAIEFTPGEAGEFDFHCGMNMVHGRLTVK